METRVRVSAGNYAKDVAAGFGKIQASVIVNEERLHNILGLNYKKRDVRDLANAFTKLLQERGVLDCNVIFYVRDPHDLKDSLDHLVVQFTLDIPLPSPAQIRSEIKI